MPASGEHDRRATHGPPAAADFDALDDARYGAVVAMVYALVGDLAEAQDLAQESFCRAWQRWSDVVLAENVIRPGQSHTRPLGILTRSTAAACTRGNAHCGIMARRVATTGIPRRDER